MIHSVLRCFELCGHCRSSHHVGASEQEGALCALWITQNSKQNWPNSSCHLRVLPPQTCCFTFLVLTLLVLTKELLLELLAWQIEGLFSVPLETMSGH